MDEPTIRRIQMEGAEALLDNGVSVPLKSVRIPFKREPLTIRLVMKRPCLSGQIRIAKTYLEMGVTSEDMWGFTKEQEMAFIAEHGRQVARMIAYTVCRGWVSRHLLVWLTTWIVMNWMSNDYLINAMLRFVSLLGTDPFIPIIRSAEMTNPMKLRLSQRKTES